MTPPSVIIPRSANELKKAKQLSGTASASNKSKFMAKSVCLWLRRPPNSSPPRRSDNAVQKIYRPKPKADVECTEEGRAKALARHRKAEAVPLPASALGQHRHGERTKVRDCG